VTDRTPGARLGSSLRIVGPNPLVTAPPWKKFLTVWIRRVQPQPLQGARTCAQKESHTLHPEEVHVTKMESPKESNLVLHWFLHCETRQRQPPTQRGYGERNEVHISRAIPSLERGILAELEVLEIREESDEIQDLPRGASWFPESEESKSRREVSKVPLDVRHEAGYLEVVYSEVPEVFECGKVTQGEHVKTFGGEGMKECADTESLDEREQTEVV